MAALSKRMPPHRLAQSDDGLGRLCAGRLRASRPPCPLCRISMRRPNTLKSLIDLETLSGRSCDGGSHEHSCRSDGPGEPAEGRRRKLLCWPPWCARVSVTAAKAGAKAVIRPDGSIAAGWIGGWLRPRRGAQGGTRKRWPTASRAWSRVQPEDLLAELGVKPGENRDGVRFAKNSARARAPWTFLSSRYCLHPSLVTSRL